MNTMFRLAVFIITASFHYSTNAQCSNHSLDLFSTVPIKIQYSFLQVGDVNGDNRDDVISSQLNGSDSRGTTLYLSSSNGSPGSPIFNSSAPAHPLIVDTSYRRLAAAANDLAYTGNYTTDTLYVYHLKKWNQLLFLTNQVPHVNLSDVRELYDYDYDGFLDIISVTREPPINVNISLGTGGGSFQPTKILSPNVTTKSNITEVAIGNFLGVTPYSGYRRNLGIGRTAYPYPSFTPANISIFYTAKGVKQSPMHSCDVPSDIGNHVENLFPLKLKDETVILSQPRQGPMFVLRTKKQPGPVVYPIEYVCKFSLIPNSHSMFATIGDLNGDGVNDIVWLRQQDRQIWYALSDLDKMPGDWPQYTLGVSESVENIAAGYLNSDKLSDLVVKTSTKLLYFKSKCTE